MPVLCSLYSLNSTIWNNLLFLELCVCLCVCMSASVRTWYMCMCALVFVGCPHPLMGLWISTMGILLCYFSPYFEAVCPSNPSLSDVVTHDPRLNFTQVWGIPTVLFTSEQQMLYSLTIPPVLPSYCVCVKLVTHKKSSFLFSLWLHLYFLNVWKITL